MPKFELDIAPSVVLPMATMKPGELKAVREKLKLTQAQLAKALGVDRVTVARWETGLRKLPPMLALAIKGFRSELRKGRK